MAKKKILIIDDQAFYLNSLEVALKKIFSVETSTNYADAIEKLEKTTVDEFDAALIDIRLDDKDDENIDGLKILEWIKMNKPEIIVFMMSSYKVFNYGVKALNMGATYFFEKPLDIISIMSIIDNKITVIKGGRDG